MILPGILSSQISGHLFTLTGAYDALATVTVPSGGASSITFSAIPQTGYSHLQIRASSAATTGFGIAYAQFNADATSGNYYTHAVGGDGSSPYAYGTADFPRWVETPSAANVKAGSVFDILDYTNTNKYKTTRSLTGADWNGTGTVTLFSGLWKNTSAINRIDLTASNGNWTQYSQFSLYGIK